VSRTFAIKKIQDEDGNDIDVTRFTLLDIFEDNPTGKKVLNVIPTRIDRDISIPVTSGLRPLDAFRRPPVPLFDQPYANLHPDRPVSSTERDLEDEEDTTEEHGNGTEADNDGKNDEHDEDVRPQDRVSSARGVDMDVASDGEEQHGYD
jgi:hypothetical protein